MPLISASEMESSSFRDDFAPRRPFSEVRDQRCFGLWLAAMQCWACWRWRQPRHCCDAVMSNVIKFSKKKKPPNPKSGSAHNRPNAWAVVVTALAVVAAIFYHPSLNDFALTGPSSSPASNNAGVETQSARFSYCFTGGGLNCVVDGDTFWFGGEKFRISDIDAPETHSPRCQSEAELGQRATVRLQELLNAGPFQLEADARDRDRYGRKLRTVMRGGTSVGLQLVSEGLARPWDGGRKPWC